MTSPRQAPWRSAWARWGWLWLAALAAGGAWADDRALDGPDGAESELRTKATYLYKFGAFIEWPAQAFPGPDAPIVIGVLDADGLADELATLVDGRSVQGRPVLVRKLHAGDLMTGVHVLFVGRSGEHPLVDAFAAVRRQPMLTVADTGVPAEVRSMIRFVVVDGRLRFDVSPKVAEQANLGISARLLAVAYRVDTRGAP